MTLSTPTILLLLLLSCYTPWLSSAHNPWDYFHNLTGCHAGESREGLAGLKAYLNQFGYLTSSSSSPSNFSDDFDDELEAALIEYQRTFNLNATGSLDAATADLMSQPRCGVPDHRPNSSSSHPAALHGRGLYSYFTGAPRWSRRSLTYFVRQGPSDPATRPVLMAVFARAFARWAEVTPLKFSVADSEDSADMVLGFFRGGHGDGEPFDGQLGTLAHAFSPTDGRLHFDADEEWVASSDETGDIASLQRSLAAVDLESVAVHEIGHLLGLGHSDVEGSVMYPTLRSRSRKVTLERDDVQGIQSLYGRNPTNGLGSGAFARSPPSMTEDTGAMSAAVPVPGPMGGWGVVGLVSVGVGALLVL